MSHLEVLNTQSSSLKTEEDINIDLMIPIEVANCLRVSIKTVYRLTEKGEIPHRKIGGQIRYFKSDLNQWLKGESDDRI